MPRRREGRRRGRAKSKAEPPRQPPQPRDGRTSTEPPEQPPQPGRVRRLGWILGGVAVVAVGALIAAYLLPSAGRREAERLEFRRHLRQGLEQMRVGLFQSAAAEFEACAAIDPADPDLLFHRARLRLAGPDRASRAEAVVSELEELARQDPEDLGLRTCLREVLLDPAFGINDRERARRHDAAFARLGDDLARFCTGLLDFQTGRSRDRPLPRLSPGEAEGLLVREPGNLAARLSLAIRAMAQQESADGAYEHFDAILEREPDLIAPRFLFAGFLTRTLARLKTGRDADGSGQLPLASSLIGLELARSYYERALDLLPPGSALSALAVGGLADVEMQMGQWDSALQLQRFVLDQSMRLSTSDRADIYWNMGVVDYLRGDDPSAVRNLVASLELRPALGIRWNLQLACDRMGGCPPEVPESMRFTIREESYDRADPPPVRFTDIAAQAGVAKVAGAGPSAWADTDGDGDLDLLAAGCDTYVSLYRNEGDGTFTDVSGEAGLLDVDSGFSATFADYDNDGDPDLYIGRYAWAGPADNSLYRNNGDGTFSDVTAESGLACPGSSFVHAWGDFDNDGFLDLYVAQGIAGDGSTNRLFRNNGDGTFTDDTARAGLAEPSGVRTIGFALGDYDKDGWLDIFVNAFDPGGRCRLYRNDGDGTFTEVAARAGVDCRAFPRTGYIAMFADTDNDTWPDLILTKLAPWRETLVSLDASRPVPPNRRSAMLGWCTKLFRNNRNGTFTDVSLRAGFVEPVGTMGGNVGDVDNDGFVDLYLATGDPAMFRLEPNRLFRNNGDGSFTDVTMLSGTGHLGKGHGSTFADFDRDGDLDLYTPQGGFVHGDLWPCALYRNDEGNRNNWLRLDLVGTKSNRDAVGAQVTVRAGARTLYQEVRGSGAFGSSNEKTLHFGLGGAGRADSVEVRWPSGFAQTLGPVPARTTRTITEGE